MISRTSASCRLIASINFLVASAFELLGGRVAGAALSPAYWVGANALDLARFGQIL